MKRVVECVPYLNKNLETSISTPQTQCLSYYESHSQRAPTQVGTPSPTTKLRKSLDFLANI